jgi:hypothetical protein
MNTRLLHPQLLATAGVLAAVVLVPACAGGPTGKRGAHAAEAGGNGDAQRYPVVMSSAVLSAMAAGPDVGKLRADLAAARAVVRPLLVGDAGKHGRVLMDPATSTANANDPGCWAAVMPASTIQTFFDFCRSQPGWVHLSSPTVLAAPGQWAAIRCADTDKPGNAAGFDLKLAVNLESAPELSMRWARPDGQTIVSGDHLDIPEGMALACMIRPAAGEAAWHCLVLTPTVIRSAGEIPAQTSEGLSGD